MKTNFTSSITRTLFFTFIVAFSTLNLSGQTTYPVSVADYSFSPSQLTITAGDKVIWTNSGGSHNVNGTKSTFASNPESFGNSVGSGWTYEFVFNTAGTYNYQCDPHASMGMTGKVIVNPKTTDPLKLTVNFTAMTPHVGQTLWLAVIDKTTNVEIGRAKVKASVAFSIEVPGIELGKSYWVDFFADHNRNGVYNAPPTDHAWRLSLNNVVGNSVIDFVHNTTFTDIAWKTKLTVHFSAMTPHLGQTLTLYVKDKSTGTALSTVVVPSVTAAFDVSSWDIKPGGSYNIDFWADHNRNGVYNAPPTDHAWRITLNNDVSDSLFTFVHNTTFTDIFSTTSAQNLADGLDHILLYPNPASQYIELTIPRNYVAINSLKVYSITGTLIDQKVFSGNSESFRYDVSQLKNGLYFMEVNSGNNKDVQKFLKQ